MLLERCLAAGGPADARWYPRPHADEEAMLSAQLNPFTQFALGASIWLLTIFLQLLLRRVLSIFIGHDWACRRSFMWSRLARDGCLANRPTQSSFFFRGLPAASANNLKVANTCSGRAACAHRTWVKISSQSDQAVANS